MVSIIAKKIAIKRQYNGEQFLKDEFPTILMIFFFIQLFVRFLTVLILPETEQFL